MSDIELLPLNIQNAMRSLDARNDVPEWPEIREVLHDISRDRYALNIVHNEARRILGAEKFGDDIHEACAAMLARAEAADAKLIAAQQYLEAYASQCTGAK